MFSSQISYLTQFSFLITGLFLSFLGFECQLSGRNMRIDGMAMHFFVCFLQLSGNLVCCVSCLKISDLENVGVHVSLDLATSILSFGSR